MNLTETIFGLIARAVKAERRASRLLESIVWYRLERIALWLHGVSAGVIARCGPHISGAYRLNLVRRSITRRYPVQSAAYRKGALVRVPRAWFSTADRN